MQVLPKMFLSLLLLPLKDERSSHPYTSLFTNNGAWHLYLPVSTSYVADVNVWNLIHFAGLCNSRDEAGYCVTVTFSH